MQEEMNGDKAMWMKRYAGHSATRVLTAVIVLIFVFWCGFEFGEMRTSIVGQMHDGYGYGMMRGGYYDGGMMGGYYYGSRVIPATSTNGSTATGGTTAPGAPVQNAR